MFGLRYSDINTKAFHSAVNGRRSKKRITMLQDDDDKWLETGKGLEEHIKQYFIGLFTYQAVNVGDVISCIENRVSDEANAALLAPF